LPYKTFPWEKCVSSLAKDKGRPMSIKEAMAADTLEGAAAIAAFIGKTERQTEHLLSKRRLPAFKIGNVWHMRRSTYLKFIERLEAKATEAA
jgi:hypothetical protein